VVISRNSSNDIKIRELYVAIDDEEQRTLLFGQAVTLPATLGKHTILATNRLFSESMEFELAEGETARFAVANIAGGCAVSFAMIVGVVPYRVSLRRE
jgi:hypothetical protein